MTQTAIEYIARAMKLSDSYYEQLQKWYKEETDISIIPEAVLEGYLGLLGTLYITFAFEMERLDKWYAEEFDREKFAPENSGDKPLSDKATDQRLALRDDGIRRKQLERRLAAIKFVKESLSRALEARRMNKDYSRRN